MQNIFSEICSMRLSLYLKVACEEVSPEFQLFGFFNGSWSISQRACSYLCLLPPAVSECLSVFKPDSKSDVSEIALMLLVTTFSEYQ